MYFQSIVNINICMSSKFPNRLGFSPERLVLPIGELRPCHYNGNIPVHVEKASITTPQ